MQGIKLITFDATNTVLKFRIPPWQFYSVIARDHGYAVEEETLKTQMKESFKIMNVKHPNFGKCGVNWENWWKEVVKLTFNGQLPSDANIDDIANKLINEFRTTKCWSVAEGSFKLLNYFKQKHATVGVISNFDPRLNEILHNVGLHKYFNFIITSYDIGFSKPDRRIFESAEKAFKKDITPSECLHIGDDYEKDYEGARSAGWHALLVTSAKVETPAARGHVFPDINQLFIAVNNDKIVLT